MRPPALLSCRHLAGRDWLFVQLNQGSDYGEVTTVAVLRRDARESVGVIIYGQLAVLGRAQGHLVYKRLAKLWIPRALIRERRDNVGVIRAWLVLLL